MRLLLADDQRKVRSALRLLLEQEPGLSIVGEAADSEDLLAQVKVSCPDLVLLDWGLPGQQPADMLSLLRQRCPHLLVIALSSRPEIRQDTLAAGVDAFVSKGDPPEQLLSALHAVSARQGS